MQKNLHISKKSSTFAAENIKQRFYILRIIIHNKIIHKCLTTKNVTSMKTIEYKNKFYHYAYAVVLVYQNEENKKVKSTECIFLDEGKAIVYATKKEKVYKVIYDDVYVYIDTIRIEL